jgi:hypothetical protein
VLKKYLTIIKMTIETQRPGPEDLRRTTSTANLELPGGSLEGNAHVALTDIRVNPLYRPEAR